MNEKELADQVAALIASGAIKPTVVQPAGQGRKAQSVEQKAKNERLKNVQPAVLVAGDAAIEYVVGLLAFQAKNPKAWNNKAQMDRGEATEYREGLQYGVRVTAIGTALKDFDADRFGTDEQRVAFTKALVAKGLMTQGGAAGAYFYHPNAPVDTSGLGAALQGEATRLKAALLRKK